MGSLIKKIVYVDMDGVLCDFKKAALNSEEKDNYPHRPDLIPNIFRDLELIPGAKEGVNFLNDNFTTYILSSPSWDNYESWTHKRLWVEKNLGNKFRKKLILSHNKSLCAGDYLIDDNPWNGAKEFKGEWIQFGAGNFSDWISVINYFKKKYTLK